MSTIDPSYLIPDLRLHLGDTNSASYRYTDEWLKIALLAAVKALGFWWNVKYLVDDTTDTVYRNPLIFFTEEEPPIILQKDEILIIIMANIIILEGSLEQSSWNIMSWKDHEISFTNLEQGRVKSGNLGRLWDLLLMYLTPPTKRLVSARKQSLHGYLKNRYENRD